jgi:ABC-type lipoprotein export system ATPase subunit/acyl-CoA synthetase (AMP-forming)/AMP-acid ligase II
VTPPAHEPSTLAEVLVRRGGEEAPGGLTYAASSGTDAADTYRDLLDAARAGLAVLRGEGLRPGDFAILLLTSSRDVLPAFWGCVLGGIVPTILSVPRSLARDTEPLRKLRHVWTLLDRPVVILGEEHASGLSRLGDGEHPLPGLHAITYPRLSGGAPAAMDHRAQPDDIAILQFSSGSTGTPNGVRLTHSNLLTNLGDIAFQWGVTAEDTFVTWMPESHDMGLICMHLQPLYAGASQVKLSPLAFVRDPATLLTTITRHRGTVTAAPNFGLALLLEKALGRDDLDVDLSSLRVFANAAEPISVDVVRRFVEACGPLGMPPEAMTCSYGLAEATVGVTSTLLHEPPAAARLERDAFYQHKVVPAAGDDPTAVEVACVGHPAVSITLRIAGEDGEALPDDSIGEIQLAGPTITPGYQGDAGGTAELLAGGWLHTGDLGFTRDGMLYVTGRIKDVIFVQGNNVYAADVEARVSELSPLRPGEVVACGYTDWDSGREQLALFVKARRVTLSDDALLDLRQRLLEVLGLGVDTVVRVPTIPRTTSGKLQRHKLAEQLREGDFAEEVGRWRELCRERGARRRPLSVEEALRAGGDAAPPAAEAVALTKVYGAGHTAVTALDGVDLAVPAGSLTAIMGPSGSGKSTLLHCMAGLDRPTSGSAIVAGARLEELDDRALTALRRDRLGFVFQAFNLVPTLTAAENIALPLRLAGARPDPAWLDTLVTVTGLGDRLSHRPAELSGGQQQRVAVARALVARPAVVFADEPTGNLDSRSAAGVLALLRRCVDEFGQAIVIVTHDAAAAAHADEIVFLADGRIAGRTRATTTEAVLDRLKSLESGTAATGAGC